MYNLPTILFNNESRTLQFALRTADGLDPLDLTGMSLYFSVGDASLAPQFFGLMSITSAVDGEVEVTLTPTDINALTPGRLRYSIRQTAPTNRVLQIGSVQVDVTF